MKLKTFVLAFAALCSVVTVSAKEVAYSYSTNTDYENWGAKLAQDYDLAVNLPGRTFQGLKITKISVPVVVTENINNYKVWLSNELTLATVNGKKVNMPDVMTADVTPETSGDSFGYINYTFSEPYTITDAGIYVGYSLTVAKVQSDLERYPVILTTPGVQNGFFLHSSKTYRQWVEKSETLDFTVPIKVYVEGDFSDNAVTLDAISSLLVRPGGAEVALKVFNLGANAVESVGYAVTVNGSTFTGEYKLPTPIDAIYGLKGKIMIEFPAMEEGEYPCTIALTKVNGVANESPASEISPILYVVDAEIVNHPLMEEYTGTWCGWCTRGWMALEKMTELHPDFVAIAYHDGDPMAMAAGYPQVAPGFPYSYLNRTLGVDPYYGSKETEFGIERDWLALSDETALAGLGLKATYNADNTVTVTSDVVWAVEPGEGEYRVEYVLTGDGFQEPTWTQANYYVNSYSQSDAPLYMEPFCRGGQWGYSSVPMLVFNDVALITSGLRGVAGSVPGNKVAAHNTYTYTFKLSDSKIVDKAKKLNVVAMLLKVDNKYGTVINSNKVEVDGFSGITGVSVTKEVETVTYYDLYGRETQRPQRGMFIKSVRYADGTVSTTKELR